MFSIWIDMSQGLLTVTIMTDEKEEQVEALEALEPSVCAVGDAG